MQCMNSEWNIHLVSWWKKVAKKERNHCKMGGFFCSGMKRVGCYAASQVVGDVWGKKNCNSVDAVSSIAKVYV